ncbi:cell division protein FtsZ [Candidatus Babeliales bacterium]|nr:cell division protein FtsZ [Candidatus Babeliales bacterium]
MIEFEREKENLSVAVVKVVGVGGAGGNTLNSMIEAGFEGIEFIATNTDAQALRMSKASHCIQLGVKSTKGLGSGANPELGRRAAEEDLDKVLEAVGDADIVFLSAGMGGGTGSGGLPVIARALKQNGILTVAIVTKPFVFEGKRRARIADEAIEALKSDVDTLIVIPNQKLLGVVDQNVSMIDAFSMINNILNQSVRAISDIISKPGHINVDFADMREIMQGMGLAVMGTARGTGESRARRAAEEAISSPLLENMSIAGARGVLLNISGGVDLGLHEISEAASVVYEQADEDANIILGSVINHDLHDEIVVTIIATGFNTEKKQKPQLAKKEVDIKQAVLSAAELLDEPEHEIVAAPQEIAPKEQIAAPVEDLPEAGMLDIDDLDVPTFLRKEMNQKTVDSE